jgi:hypothetical protein
MPEKQLLIWNKDEHTSNQTAKYKGHTFTISVSLHSLSKTLVILSPKGEYIRGERYTLLQTAKSVAENYARKL